MEALARTTFLRALKDPKAIMSLVILMRHCGYGTDDDDTPADLALNSDYDAIIDDFLARNGLEKTPADSIEESPGPAAAPKDPKEGSS